ncbi:hypothetical protein BDF14DRAFT_1739577 [Spinellus fusiger]|nr:hypothetical protein BDF14DRAFT_1739577 [Spinellus fusiger]
MLLANHYNSTYPTDTELSAQSSPSRRPSLDPNNRTLYPLNSFRHHPYLDRSTPSPSSSRRGSCTDPALHATFRPSSLSPLPGNSPPSSPHTQILSSPSSPHHRMDLPRRYLPTLPSTGHGWRRDSLPSISHLTQGTSSEYVRVSPSPLVEEASRRHSIAVSPCEPTLSDEQEPAAVQGHHDGEQRRASQMYSRSPELRVSHKLAERKRRREMKDLFDELRDLLPGDRGLKTSKWEILSKTLDYISTLRDRDAQMEQERLELQKELALLKY